MKKILLASGLLSVGLSAFAQQSVTTGGQKYVVLEDVTGAWCQYCPDGTVKQEAVLAMNPTAIGAALHGGGSTDKMKFPDGETVQANPNLVCGYPGGLINRKNFDGAYTGSSACTKGPSVNRAYWDMLVNQEAALQPDWDVSMQHSFDPATRELTVTVTAKALKSMPGKYNLNVWIIEDSVVGPNAVGYNQVNYYNNTSGHPYYGAGASIVGFVHRHVERAYLGGPWGTTGVIPANPTESGTWSKTYTYVIPEKYDLTTVGAPLTRLGQISMIGMVMKDTASKFDREIMNAVHAKLVQSPTGIAEVAIHDLSVFPNPARDQVTIKGILNQTGAVSVSIVNTLGQIVLSKNYDYRSSLFGEVISLDGLTDGVYYLTIETPSGARTVERLVVTK